MIGKTLAHYEVIGHLGAGGMGEVFKARDTKLGRDVALKVLPLTVASDPERLARFEREAQLLASLNHPNIAAIYGVEQADDVRFLVMELAEGEDLQRRLGAGSIPLEDVLAIARGIAEGLEEAHERGVVHRDLKPANVMVSDARKVKILDFGLARAYAGETAEEGDPALSPTITARMTQAGTVLGSAAYMSPEQAKGHEVDRRTDIWAFGVILYEMITGKRLFEGETVSDTLASVLKDPIDIDSLDANVPVSIRAVLSRCLERDPLQRLRDIGEARIHLDPSAGTTVLSGSLPEAKAARGSSGKLAILPWVLFAIASLVAVGLAVMPRGTTETAPSELPLMRTSIEAPEPAKFHLSGANPGPVAVSPEGTRAVFTARDENGVRSLWLQDLRYRESQPIPDTDDAQYPFWSPDGGSIAYHTQNELKIVDLRSRTNRAIARTNSGKGGTWIDEHTILFAQNSTAPISRVDLRTGEIDQITELSDTPGANSHRLPRSLGDGAHFIYAARTSETRTEGAVLAVYCDLETGETKVLVGSDGQAEFAKGHLFYAQRGKLYARPLDTHRGEFTGPPILVAEGVGLIPGAALSLVSVSPGGTLAFHPGERTTLLSNLGWFGLDGEDLGFMGGTAGFGTFHISPDGERVAFTAFDNRLGTGDLYLEDLVTGTRSRLTFDPADDQFPIWAPDGKTLYYRYSSSGTNGGLHEVRALEPDGHGDSKSIFRHENITSIDSISPDGQYLGVTLGLAPGGQGQGGMQAYILALDGSEELIHLDPQVRASSSPRFSPDGRWIAYAIEDGELWRLHLKTNPPGSRKWEIYSKSAYFFSWHPDGKQLIHQFESDDLLTTRLDLAGSSPVIGTTTTLMSGVQPPISGNHRFQVDPDGSRLLISAGGSMDDDRPIRLVTGWAKILENAVQ